LPANPKNWPFTFLAKKNKRWIKLKYKETARSPQYGRIYGYNDAGKKIEELD
jgi:hypothetical protein